jgi:hypothetical protein
VSLVKSNSYESNSGNEKHVDWTLFIAVNSVELLF